VAFFTYIMSSRPYGTLYTGYTDDIWRRVTEHCAMENPSFTEKYGVTRLVWVEKHENSRRGVPSRAPDQGVATCMEDSIDRGIQPGLG